MLGEFGSCISAARCILRGICEPIRLLFHYAKVSFEDARISRKQWLALKDSTVYGKVPILEVDGKPLTYCHTISRYLARTFGLAGAVIFGLSELGVTNAIQEQLIGSRLRLTVSSYICADLRRSSTIYAEISDFHSDVAMDLQPYLYVVAGFHQGDRVLSHLKHILPNSLYSFEHRRHYEKRSSCQQWRNISRFM